jgi:hypothetical protein
VRTFKAAAVQRRSGEGVVIADLGFTLIDSANS